MTNSPVSPASDGTNKEARIAALRARYDALRSEGQSPDRFETQVSAAPRIPHDIRTQRVRLRTIIPAGWYWCGRVSVGTCLRLDNKNGTPGIACLFWNAADPTERYCATDTVKVQWTASLGRGRLLLSDMGRILASIIEDTCGHHDTLLGAGAPRRDEASSPLLTRNGQENLLLAAAKLGLDPRDLHAPVTFFAPVSCRANNRFLWDASVPLARHFVDLHTEMDLLAAVSNVPHPMAPELPPHDVELVLWQPEHPDVARFCHEATAEAQRAHARTRLYRAESGC